jgi:sigma-E factor negative regulatory protein RseA
MSQPDSDRSNSESNRRILSALADGDATDSEAARAFQAWRDDADARASWHAYQLIGDVLRSDDLAAEPAADEAFLVALRARLADEPVVLAPQPRVEAEPIALPAAVNASTAAARSRGRWQGPVAMAAGFLAVIGVLNVAAPVQAWRRPAAGVERRVRPGAGVDHVRQQQRRRHGQTARRRSPRARPRPTSSRRTWRRTASRR